MEAVFGRYLFTITAFVMQMCQPQEQKTLCFDSQWGSSWHISANRWRQRYLRYSTEPAFYSTTGRTILCYVCFRAFSTVRTGSSQFKGNLFSRRRTKRPQTRGSLCGTPIHGHPFSIFFHFFQTQSPTFSLRSFELRGGASPSPSPPPPKGPFREII